MKRKEPEVPESVALARLNVKEFRYLSLVFSSFSRRAITICSRC